MLIEIYSPLGTLNFSIFLKSHFCPHVTRLLSWSDNIPTQLSKTFRCQKVGDKPHKDSWSYWLSYRIVWNLLGCFPQVQDKLLDLVPPMTKRKGHQFDLTKRVTVHNSMALEQNHAIHS